MKTNFSTEATVKRSISIKPIGDSDFVCYEDTFITTINGLDKQPEPVVTKGITRYDVIEKCSNSLNKIERTIGNIPRMYRENACAAVISKWDMDSVLSGKMHITDAVNPIINDTTDFDIVIPVLWNLGTYRIMDFNYKFISIPIQFDDVNGSVTNEYYDLEKLLEKLKQDPCVIDRASLEIEDIPYYNATDYSNQYISFKYLLSNEEYDEIAEYDNDGMRNIILQRIAYDCKKKKKEICISCDICKYGESHDYVKDNYYCKHPENPRCTTGDSPIVFNCPDGELDEWAYNLKYKHK